MSDLGIFVVATKSYLNYAESLIQSAVRFKAVDLGIKFVLLTDDPDRARKLNTHQRIAVEIERIDSFGWPEATLLRFRFMRSAWSKMNCDVVAYVDADMEFCDHFSIDDFVRPLVDRNGKIALVKHPGYFNRNWFYRQALRSPLGPWETRMSSTAFVPLEGRSTYVCGGIFWGIANHFKNMITDLDTAVDTDLMNSIRAKHNDESHLNRWWYQNEESCIALSPEWAFDTTYRHLRKLTPKVIAILKEQSFKRIPTFSQEVIRDEGIQ